MEIYLDGLFYRGAGIGRYYESLIKEFAKRDMKIYTCVPERLINNFQKDFDEVLDKIEPIFVDYEKFSLKGFLKQSIILKKLESKVDLFFFPHVNLPSYIPKNTVTTIHDFRPFTEFWDRVYIKRILMKFFYKRAIEKSKWIICVSETVHKELISRYPDSAQKSSVIYEFIDDKFVSVHGKKRRLIDTSYILFVGNRKKHKNLENLLKAFSLLSEKIPHKLVIAGTRDKAKEIDEIDILINKLGLKDKVVNFVFPDDETLISLYQHADVFVFPSFFEGFGLPPIEAVSLGCPVILSDIPILREIFGDSGIYFNPSNPRDIADKIYYILSNGEIREKYLQRQKERIKIFDKQKIINKYIEIFDRVTKY